MSQVVTEDKIRKANAGFWEQMLSIRLEPICGSPSDSPATRCIGVNHVVGHCDLTGKWVGRIEVRLSSGLALHATSAMLMQPEETVCAADTLDAIKEIANMIAGTLKSDLPSPCYITVPGACVEDADVCVLPRTHDSVAVFFVHETGELMIRVLQDCQTSRLEAELEASFEGSPV